MNFIGKAIVGYLIVNFIALFVQLIEGMPPIGMIMFIVGMPFVVVGLFFIEFKPKSKV